MRAEGCDRQASMMSEKSRLSQQVSHQLSGQLSQELNSNLMDLPLSPCIAEDVTSPSDSGLSDTERGPFLIAAVLSLYSTNANTDMIIESFYTKDCKFIDPLVIVKGQEDVKAQFRSLRMMFEHIRVDLHTAGVTGNGLVIESTTSFVPKFLPSACTIRLRLLTQLTLSKSGSISIHEDHWSLHGLWASIPIIGTLYNLFRSAFGAASSTLVNKLWLDSEGVSINKDRNSYSGIFIVMHMIGNLCKFPIDILRTLVNMWWLSADLHD